MTNRRKSRKPKAYKKDKKEKKLFFVPYQASSFFFIFFRKKIEREFLEKEVKRNEFESLSNMSEELLALQVTSMMDEIIALRNTIAEKNTSISNLKKTLRSVLSFCEEMGYNLTIPQKDGSDVPLSSTDSMFQ